VSIVRETLRSLLEPPLATDPAHDTTKLAWILRLRWIALCAQLGAILPALEFRLLEASIVPWYVGVIAVVASINVVSWARLRRGARASQAELCAQLGVDVAGTSVLLALTGGAWNPLVTILFVHAGLGALLLDGRLSLFFFGALMASLLALQALSRIPPGLQDARLPAQILFPAQLLVAMGFWFLTAWLSRTLTALHRQFAALGERKVRASIACGPWGRSPRAFRTRSPRP
jgi:two-component system sensor histidine kinase RegB